MASFAPSFFPACMPTDIVLSKPLERKIAPLKSKRVSYRPPDLDEPFLEDLYTLDEMLDPLVEKLEAQFIASKNPSAGRLPKLYRKGVYEGIETETCYKLKVLLPGYRKDDVKLTVENDKLLRIGPNKAETEAEAATKAEAKAPEKEEWTDFTGVPKLVIELPTDAAVDQLGTKFNNGALLVTVPKKPTKVVDVELND